MFLGQGHGYKSEILLLDIYMRFYNFEVNKWTCHNFIDSDRRYKTLGSEAKDFITAQKEAWASCI